MDDILPDDLPGDEYGDLPDEDGFGHPLPESLGVEINLDLEIRWPNDLPGDPDSALRWAKEHIQKLISQAFERGPMTIFSSRVDINV